MYVYHIPVCSLWFLYADSLRLGCNVPEGMPTLLFSLRTGTSASWSFPTPFEVVFVFRTVYFTTCLKAVECTLGVFLAYRSLMYGHKILYGAAPVTFPAVVFDKSQHQILQPTLANGRRYACRPSFCHAVVYSFY